MTRNGQLQVCVVPRFGIGDGLPTDNPIDIVGVQGREADVRLTLAEVYHWRIARQLILDTELHQLVHANGEGRITRISQAIRDAHPRTVVLIGDGLSVEGLLYTPIREIFYFKVAA